MASPSAKQLILQGFYNISSTSTSIEAERVTSDEHRKADHLCVLIHGYALTLLQPQSNTELKSIAFGVIPRISRILPLLSATSTLKTSFTYSSLKPIQAASLTMVLKLGASG